ncbi:hypothetical protein BH09ACT7_BH09ACT7_19630 [soil metagenome]
MDLGMQFKAPTSPQGSFSRTERRNGIHKRSCPTNKKDDKWQTANSQRIQSFSI